VQKTDSKANLTRGSSYFLFDPWAEKNSSRLWVASLQVSEDPIKGGFFVYSHQAFATSPSLTEAIISAISLAARKSIEVALYFGYFLGS